MTPAVENLIALYERNAQRADDIAWYDRAKSLVRQRAAERGVDPEVYAAIVAATSPMQQWASRAGGFPNLDVADRVIDWDRGLIATPRTLSSSARNGAAILNGADPSEVLGPKTRRFWQALLGDDLSIVLDRWALRAIGWPRESIKEAEWWIAAEPYWDAAERLGISPAGLQAAVWTQIKREWSAR
jgi:hypothetical protein